MKTLGRDVLATLFFFCIGSFTSEASQFHWPLHRPFAIVNTISTLQFYGPTPGFHHGLDMHAPAGTPVYAPVGGVVGIGYYYPRIKVPFTYGVFIKGDDGFRWEFHHIDPGTIPEDVAALAKHQGRVAPGTFLGRIYDAPKLYPSILPHVHINVIDRNGYYQNPLKFFPPVSSSAVPKIRGIYLVGTNNRVVAGQSAGLLLPAVILPGKYELVLDVIDFMECAPLGDSVALMRVLANGASIGSFDFRDHLPQKSFIKGVRNVYRIEPITLPDGKTLKNQVNEGKPRRFLYRFAFDTSKMPIRPDGTVKIAVRTQDFANKSSEATFKLKIKLHR